MVWNEAATVIICYPELNVKTTAKKGNLKLTVDFIILNEDPIKTLTECLAQMCSWKPGPLNP